MARRSQAAITRELEQIESLVRRHSDGVRMRALLKEFSTSAGKPLGERTMLRRLALLERAGRIRSEGRTSAAQYFAGAVTSTLPAPARREIFFAPVTRPEAARTRESPEPLEGYISLSAMGQEVRALVKRPIFARKPVGYREEFLRAYLPGQTWYLSAEQRAALLELGQTPDVARAAGTFAREVFERLLIDLSWASSRLEGNTYSRLDTKNLLEFGVRAEGKDASEAQMLLNHKRAIELLVEHAQEVAFNRYTLLNLHAALSENLMGTPVDEGRLRTRMVGITGTTFVPLSIPQKLVELFDLILDKLRAIPDPFEQSFFVMVHLPYLQPFTDVNKRTSRLAANIPLVKANLCPLSFVGVPSDAYIEGTLGVYEENRVELLRDVFLWAYERSCAQYQVVKDSLPDPDPIRLRYRPQLIDAVRSVVLDGEQPRLSTFRNWAEDGANPSVPFEDRERFSEVALGLVLDLHEGALARYGLSQGEFKQFRARLAATFDHSIMK